MNRIFLLPKMAATGIRKNASVYLPYILTMAFSVCVFFIFSCIVGNEMLQNVPYAQYVLMLLEIGKVLLGIIIIPFLFYTNSFLIKRRKKELGLYTVLGLEKKHVGVMMLIETVLIYLISLAIGLAVAVVFSKLVFLILLKFSNMPSDTSFTMTTGNFMSTGIFFCVISGLNLINNLWQVTMTNPTELLRSGKKGEKEPKHLWIYTVLGLVFLLGGYLFAITAKVGTFIFLEFFFAVFMVVLGTYFLFTSGSIMLLRALRKNKKFYYKKNNYVTVAGMLYRMKRSAASLSNICIFSTMVIITLVCTISLTIGEQDAIRFNNKYDVNSMFYYGSAQELEELRLARDEEAKQCDVTLSDMIQYSYCYYQTDKKENVLPPYNEATADDQARIVRIMPLADYNWIEGTNLTLNEGEIFVFAEAEDFGYDTMILNGNTYQVKEEFQEFRLEPKEVHSYAKRDYYVVMRDWETIVNEVGGSPFTSMRFNMTGDRKDKKLFMDQYNKKLETLESFESSRDIIDWESQMKAMDGGLLFIGIFFGMIFTICLLLIMYYKQISEGLEDQDNFHIMKQVGMSDEDVRGTINRQIKLVFILPLVAAVCHTFAGLPMTINLLYALSLFHTTQIVLVTVGTILVFAVIYGASYLLTAKSYYRIVR